MPLATPGQYAAMLDAAADGGYAYAAVNVSSSETLNAALLGFKLADAGGIVQISVGASAYMSGTTVKDSLLGARAFARYAPVVAEASPVLIALHTDHCRTARGRLAAPTPGGIRAARRTRRHPLVPLPHVRRLDPSAGRKPADRVRPAREMQRARHHPRGRVRCSGGEEDGIVGPANGHDELYTTPSDLLRVADALGIGEHGRYLLAATFGNVHGTYAPGNVVLRPETERPQALAAAHPGSRFQYVFHGSS